MKNKIIQYAKANYCICRYSGKSKTLYIESCFDMGFNHVTHVSNLIIEKFGYGIPFRISF